MTTIAEQIMTASPCFAAHRSQPFSLAEIDAHPDAGRIWATLEAVKAAVDAEVEARVEAELEEAE